MNLDFKRVAVAGVVVVLGVALGVYLFNSGDDGGTEVAYGVAGSGFADVTYVDGQANAIKERVTLPWHKEVTTTLTKFLVRVEVTNVSNGRNVECFASVDGVEVVREEAIVAGEVIVAGCTKEIG